MIDSDDLEFAQIAANALGMGDAEYSEFVQELGVEELNDWGSPYHLDSSWPDDDWLDAGVEWEISPDYKE